MKKHTLKAVFSMPDDIFYPTGTNVCVMVWEAHTPHDSTQECFFGYCKDDGFVKRKKLGRIDALGKWESIEKEWLKLYRNRDVVDGLPAQYSGGKITVSKDGDSADAFVQFVPFCGNEKVMVLSPKKTLTDKELLFYSLLINSNKYKFGYGRKWTLEKMKETIIKLPGKKDGNPDFTYMEDA